MPWLATPVVWAHDRGSSFCALVHSMHTAHATCLNVLALNKQLSLHRAINLAADRGADPLNPGPLPLDSPDNAFSAKSG